MDWFNPGVAGKQTSDTSVPKAVARRTIIMVNRTKTSPTALTSFIIISLLDPLDSVFYVAFKNEPIRANITFGCLRDHWREIYTDKHILNAPHSATCDPKFITSASESVYDPVD